MKLKSAQKRNLGLLRRDGGSARHANRGCGKGLTPITAYRQQGIASSGNASRCRPIQSKPNSDKLSLATSCAALGLDEGTAINRWPRSRTYVRMFCIANSWFTWGSCRV